MKKMPIATPVHIIKTGVAIEENSEYDPLSAD